MPHERHSAGLAGKFYQGGRHIPGNALILGFRGMPVESMESGILGIKDVIAQVV